MLRRYVKNYDYVLLTIIILLSLFGLLMVYSASMVVATGQKYQGTSELFFLQQAKWMIIGLGILFFIINVPYQFWNQTKLLFICIILLAISLLLLFIVGTTTNNAQSWFRIFGFNVQPSEIVKVIIILYLASVISKKQAYINHLTRSILPLLVPAFILVILIFKQPDAGTALIISAVVGIIILCSGISLKNVIYISMTAAVFVFLAFLSLSENQMSRIHAMIDPFADVTGGTYQLINGFQAISLGGFSGLGFGQSIQKYGYLPEPHTDFILAIISEELGFFGVFFVLACLFTIIARALVVARQCKDNFGSLLALGIAALLSIQTFINVGGLLGLIPLTGVTLPLVSYGGTSYVTLIFLLAILVNISTQVRMEKAGVSFTKKEETFKRKGNVTYLES